MATYTTDFQIRPEDGWTLVATNPGQLEIKPAVYHPWWVAITDTGTPAATLIGFPMGRDPSNRNETFYLPGGVTGLVYVRIATPTDSNTVEKMFFSVTATTGSGGGGGGGGGTAGFETVGPPFVANALVTKVSGSITLGGTAQTVFTAGQAPHGWAIENQSAGDLYVEQDATAVADQHSFRIPAGQEYVADFVTGGLVSIIGATTGQIFWGRAW